MLLSRFRLKSVESVIKADNAKNKDTASRR